MLFLVISIISFAMSTSRMRLSAAVRFSADVDRFAIVCSSLFWIAPSLERSPDTLLIAVFIVIGIITIISPNKNPRELSSDVKLDLTPSRVALVLGILIVIITVAFYAYFWDYTTDMFPSLK